MTTTTESLAAADGRLAVLAEMERKHLAEHPWRLQHEHDMRREQYTVRVFVRMVPPAGLMEEAAAAVSALRLVLDDAASQLAGARVAFPVHDSLATFAQRSRKAMRTMPDAAQAAIESLQPYHAIGGYINGPLWWLRELAAAPEILLAAGALRSAEMGVNSIRKITLTGEPAIATGAFDDGAVIAVQQTRIVGPDPKLDMFLRPEFALATAQGGPGRGRQLVPLLTEIADHLRAAVLPGLREWLPAQG